MKKSILTIIMTLFVTVIMTQNSKAQCIADTLISATNDSLYVGDTLNVNVYYDVTGSSNFTDSVWLVMDYIGHGVIMPYLHDYSDVTAAYHPNTYGNLQNKIKITSQFADTTWRKVFLYTTQNHGCGPSINIIRKYIYVKDTTHVNGFNEINHGPKIIREVHYYSITGQLYGTYPQKQNHLPNIPLIEEVIYTNNTVSTRKLLRLN